MSENLWNYYLLDPLDCSLHIAIACNVCNVECRLHSLQAQALSDATPPVGKIEPLQQNCQKDILNVNVNVNVILKSFDILILCDLVYFITVWGWRCRKDQ